MFLLRSAFWLAAAFLVIRPETDMGQAAGVLAQDAMAQGSSFVAQTIEAIECQDFSCHGGKALAVAVLGTQTSPPAVSIPLPRVRPDRAS
jgi:hypothetical protein